jgi:PAS domain S-box-containing protein
VGAVREWTSGEIDFARYLAQWVAMALEIDERQRAEANLRERELLYRLLLEHSPTPTIVSEAGGDGVFLDVNESALRLFGTDREAFVGSTPAAFSPEHQPDGQLSEEAARQHISSMLAGENPCFDWIHQDAQGRQIPCSVHLAKVPGTGAARMIAAITDKTEQIRNEETISRALKNERELGELRSRFTAIVSHEFRTPLGIIMSAIELLRNYFDRLDDSRRNELFEDIHNATRRMGVLMEQVLVLGRGDAGKLNFSPQVLDLQPLCTKVAEESSATVQGRCPIKTEFENDVSGATADEPLLRHIFSNLLTNAIKYSSAGSEVRFLIKRDAGDAVFLVEDQGIGIPKDDHSRMFEAFQRATNVGEIAGSGLGLLIAKRCVELHGGSISFISESGQGTTFIVRLPSFVY